MKILKNAALLILILSVFAVFLAGCGKSNTVSGYVVSNESYTDKESLEAVKQPDQLAAGKDVYASVYFIESPKGMEYTAKWYLDGNEIKNETKSMATDKHGVIVFSLEGEKAPAGTLKLEISYKDEVLSTREITVAGE